MLRALLVVAVVARAASADPRARVVLADPDPELARALTAALSPWADVVTDDADARYVVRREPGALVVEDRTTGAVERRPVPDGALDPVSGAAAALTVKTILRLDRPPPPPPPPPVLRIALAGGATLSGASAARGELAVAYGRTLRVGAAAMATPGAGVDAAGFKGDWRTWGIAATASYLFAFDDWEVEPEVALGFTRGTLDGTEGTVARSEHATLLRVRAGAIGWRRFGRFAVGVEAAFAATPGGDTYIKTTGMAEIFTPPSSSVELGLVVSCDLFGPPGH